MIIFICPKCKNRLYDEKNSDSVVTVDRWGDETVFCPICKKRYRTDELHELDTESGRLFNADLLISRDGRMPGFQDEKTESGGQSPHGGLSEIHSLEDVMHVAGISDSFGWSLEENNADCGKISYRSNPIPFSILAFFFFILSLGSFFKYMDYQRSNRHHYTYENVESDWNHTDKKNPIRQHSADGIPELIGLVFSALGLMIFTFLVRRSFKYYFSITIYPKTISFSFAGDKTDRPISFERNPEETSVELVSGLFSSKYEIRSLKDPTQCIALRAGSIENELGELLNVLIKFKWPGSQDSDALHRTPSDEECAGKSEDDTVHDKSDEDCAVKSEDNTVSDKSEESVAAYSQITSGINTFTYGDWSCVSVIPDKES